MELLTNEELIVTYEKAKELNIDQIFIKLILEEIILRGMELEA